MEIETKHILQYILFPFHLLNTYTEQDNGFYNGDLQVQTVTVAVYNARVKCGCLSKQ